MQTMVLRVSLTFDPVALVAWAKAQKGVCCDYPAHDAHLLDWMPPELEAQSIMAHAFLTAVEDVIEGGGVSVLEGGIPPELSDLIDANYDTALNELKMKDGVEYQAMFREMMPTCEDCEKRPANEGYVADPYASEILGDDTKKWRCSQCYRNALEEI